MAEGMHEFLRRPQGRPALIAFECAVTTVGVADPADTVDARERNGNKMLHRDCRWSPRVDALGAVVYPDKGDRALVLISDEGEPWIIEWSPNA